MGQRSRELESSSCLNSKSHTTGGRSFSMVCSAAERVLLPFAEVAEDDYGVFLSFRGE